MDSRNRPVHEFQALSRREFLRAAGVVGAGAVLLGACGSDQSKGSPTSTPGIAVDPPPETTTIRLTQAPTICLSPQYLAEEFLRADGFTDVQYLKQTGTNSLAMLASREADICLYFAAPEAIVIDAGDPVTLLAGAHVGCWELFGTERVQSVRDLRGKTVAVSEVAPTATDYAFIVSVLTFVGIDPTRDVNFEAHKKT